MESVLRSEAMGKKVVSRQELNTKPKVFCLCGNTTWVENNSNSKVDCDHAKVQPPKPDRVSRTVISDRAEIFDWHAKPQSQSIKQ